jgi:hypothetical protein
VPTSVLLAVLAAAALLALAPALVRRYDATERLVAERALSTARVLDRRRRRRTVPGPRPRFAPLTRVIVGDSVHIDVGASDVAAADVGETVIDDAIDSYNEHPPAVSALQMATVEISTVAIPMPRHGQATEAERDSGPIAEPPVVRRAVWVPVGGRDRGAGARPAADRRGTSPARRAAADRARRSRTVRRPAQSPAVYRRRRVLASLVVLNAVELIGVFTLGPGFWTGFAVTSLMLVAYVVHLRNEAMAAGRRRRTAERRAAVIAAVQAEIRLAQARRAVARRDAMRRAAAARSAAQRDAIQLTQRYVDFDPSRRIRVRGQSYETGGWDRRAVGE